VYRAAGVNLSRRGVLRAFAGAAALLSTTSLTGLAWGQEAPFSFDSLSETMRAKAAAPYSPAPVELPAFVKTLDYDLYRLIQFRTDRAVTLGPAQYQLQAFHLGWLYQEPVALFHTAGGTAAPISFSAEDFEYFKAEFKTAAEAGPLPGVAGFRINYPLNAADRFDELVSFLGASYFRALGRHNIYGASARGVVINSWLGGAEEFPHFTQFYLDTPQPGQPLVVHAALEGESLTGAYRFEISPGSAEHQDTVITVTARLFARKDIQELGLAPLTSMFLFGDSNRAQFDDFRSQVHDSNGLWIKRPSGETLWRALNNPPVLGNSYFTETNPAAFGLMQRDRVFENYQDAGAHYERRPSVVVEPIGEWGKGAIRLIEIPAELEADDNIVAFWISEKPLKAGETIEVQYRLRWGDLNPEAAGPLAHVVDTRAGQGGVSGVASAQTLRKFVVDFAGGPLESWDGAPIDVVASLSGGRVVYATASRIEANGHWRLVIDADVDPGALVELRGYLVGQGRQLTETWLYQWRAA
jgi:glucans biosynthesis protein